LAQADVKNVSQLEVEPGELPKTMTAWVIRQDREGEPKDAFQIEDIEVPEHVEGGKIFRLALDDLSVLLDRRRDLPQLEVSLGRAQSLYLIEHHFFYELFDGK